MDDALTLRSRSVRALSSGKKRSPSPPHPTHPPNPQPPPFGLDIWLGVFMEGVSAGAWPGKHVSRPCPIFGFFQQFLQSDIQRQRRFLQRCPDLAADGNI